MFLCNTPGITCELAHFSGSVAYLTCSPADGTHNRQRYPGSYQNDRHEDCQDKQRGITTREKHATTGSQCRILWRQEQVMPIECFDGDTDSNISSPRQRIIVNKCRCGRIGWKCTQDRRGDGK